MESLSNAFPKKQNIHLKFTKIMRVGSSRSVSVSLYGKSYINLN